MTEWLERVRGELAGRYRIERELGRGGAATVYLAEDLAQQRQVAVKVLHPELVEAVGGQRFLREIRLAASLHHPHLLAIHNWGETKGLFYFVAPYLPDGSLRTCLKRDRQLSVDEALRITREVADALGHVHDHGIVHRDVKPENILFAGKHACVADFGIARAVETVDGDTLTSTGLVLGTPAYMSPEQASGERTVDARSDQYSLACVLYEMLAGMPPFVGATAQSVISQRFAHAPSPVTFYRPNVPSGIVDALSRALAIAPADRFDSVREFVAALDRPAAPAIRIDPAVRLRTMRRRWFAAGAAAALIVIGLFGVDRFGGSLFAKPEVPEAAESGLRSVRGTRARKAYLRGHRAWARGDFEPAYRAFADAVAAEPAFAQGHLQLAQLGAFFRIGDEQRWRDGARRALTLSSTLEKQEAALAAGLVLLGEGQFPAACLRFDEARRLDSLDFAAWYGLGECQYLDSEVVASQRSRSKWAFRSSFNAAAAAYLRAVDLDERALGWPVYERLRTILKANTKELRHGFSVETRSRFAAYPEFSGDTVAFTPYQYVGQLPSAARPDPDKLRAALERNGAMLVSFVRTWVSKRPQSADALEAYADVLEARGDVSDLAGQISALTAVRMARELRSEPIKRLHLGSTEVSLLLKRGEFASASALADSLLDAWQHPTRDAARVLHGLAALTGRVRITARMGALASSHEWLERIVGVRLAPPLVESLALLEAYASVGACDRLEALRSDMLERVDRYVPDTRAQAMKAAATELPAMWSAGCLDERVIPFRDPAGLRTLRAQQAFARGQQNLAKAILDSSAVFRRGDRPGDFSLDFAFQEAWLRAAWGDTTAAIRQLDLVLGSLSVQAPTLVDRFSEAAALPRAMALRAELAAVRGERETAKHWARACLALWGFADPELRSVVDRMKRLSE